MQSGSVGVIYRQFALTIAISMGFSAFLALCFTPGAVRLAPAARASQGNFIFRWFNRAYDRAQSLLHATAWSSP